MKKLLSFGSLLIVFAATASAQVAATVNISYANANLSATPAPSTIVLTTLGLVALFFAFRKMRQPAAGRSAAILLVIGAAFVATKASAAFVTESMTGAGPLQFTLDDALTAQVTNNTGASQQITSITLNPNPSSLTLVVPGTTPQCTVGLTLPNGGVCYVKVIAE